MTKLPSIRPRQIEKILNSYGFQGKSSKGSHVIFKHPDGRRTVVPGHNRPVRIGTLRSILKQTKLDLNDFLKEI